MSITSQRSVRFTTVSESSSSPRDNASSLAASPRSMPATPFIGDGTLQLGADALSAQGNDSIGVMEPVTYDSESDEEPVHHASHGHPEQPTTSLFVSLATPDILEIPPPKQSPEMKKAQKVSWDVRQSPDTWFDANEDVLGKPALRDASTMSVRIASSHIGKDIILTREEGDEPLTVLDIYAGLYEVLQTELTHTDPLYAARSAQQQASIVNATAMRFGSNNVIPTAWRGQLRDILGECTMLRNIVVDSQLGKWRLDFARPEN